MTFRTRLGLYRLPGETAQSAAQRFLTQAQRLGGADAARCGFAAMLTFRTLRDYESVRAIVPIVEEALPPGAPHLLWLQAEGIALDADLATSRPAIQGALAALGAADLEEERDLLVLTLAALIIWTDPDEAIALVRGLIDRTTAVLSPYDQGRACFNLGAWVLRRGELEEGLQLTQRAITAFRGCPAPPPGLAYALLNDALANFERGDLNRALARLPEAAAAAEDNQEGNALRSIRHINAGVVLDLGDEDLTESILDETEAEFGADPDCALLRAEMLLRQRRPAAAAAQLEAARSLGLHARQAPHDAVLRSELHRQLGHLDKAWAALGARGSVPISTRFEMKRAIVEARILSDEGDSAAALAVLEQAEAAARSKGSQASLRHAQQYRLELLAAQGDFAAAFALQSQLRREERALGAALRRAGVELLRAERNAAQERLRAVRAEAAARSAAEERERALGVAEAQAEALQVLAHEIRNPLTTIGFTLEELEETVTSPALRDALRLAQGETGRITAMAHRVLSAVHDAPPPAKKQAVPLDHALARTAARTAATRVHRAQRLDLQQSGHVALADKHLLEQVLDNLVGNATKFTPRGGQLRVSTTATPDAVTLWVEDSGPGVAPDQRVHVFGKFAVATPPLHGTRSTGLGLYVTKQLVAAMEGEIGVTESELGGAAFWVRLPRA